MSILIREYQHADIQRGLPETLEALAPVNLQPNQVWNRRVWLKMFVAVDGEKVVGTVTVLVEHKFLHAGGKAGHVEDVAVHPDHQGKGIGRQLLLAAVAFCKDCGCYRVTLDCDQNKAGFYEKLGFHHNGCAMRLELT